MGEGEQRSASGASAPTGEDEATVLVGEAGPSGPPEDSNTLASGTMLGRYRIGPRLGEGGMGSVYDAHDPTLDRDVALKLLRGSARATPRERERLLREGQALAAINHPHVIQIFDAGESPFGVFLAMERLDGQDLRAWRDTEPDNETALQVYLAAADGLAAAHAAGLVHRDFKPGNVMLTKTGRVVVLDFGLVQTEGVDTAELADAFPSVEHSAEMSANSDARLTRTGTVMGTPAYMAPEQRLGKSVDARSDQYAFCVALYEVLGGRRPYDFTPVSSEGAKAIIPPLPGRSVPRAVLSVMMRGLSVDPDQRWPSMDALAEALRRARRQRARVVSAVVASAGVASVVGLMAVPGPHDTDVAKPPCDAADRMAELWNESQSRDMATSMRSSEVPYHGAAYDHAAETIDAWTQQWVETRQQWCAAPREPALREAIGACLDASLERLSFTLEALSDGTPESVKRAPALVGLLDAPTDCEDLEGRESVADPQLLSAIQAIEAEVDRAEGLVEVGRRDEARTVLEAALAQATELERASSQAVVRAELGRIAEQEAQYDKAVELYEQAYTEAVSVPRDDLAAELAIRTAAVYNSARADRQGCERWLRHAEAALQRRPDERMQAHLLRVRYQLIDDRDPAAALKLLAQERELLERLDDEIGLIYNDLNRASVEYDAGQYEKGLSLTEASLAKLEKMYGAKHPTVAKVLVNLAAQSNRGGDAERALQSLERALDILDKADDPKSHLYALQNYAIMLRDFGRHEEATGHFAQAHEAAVELFGANHPLTTSVESAMGGNYAALGQYDEAERWIQSALETRRRVLGEKHPDLAMIYTRLGNLERDRERFDAAVEHFDRARQIVGDSVGVDDDRYALALYGRGISQRDRGNLRAAKKDLEETLRIQRKIGGHPEGLARSLFVLARMYWDEGRRDEARAMVSEAEPLVQGMAGKLPGRIAQWQRDHR